MESSTTRRSLAAPVNGAELCDVVLPQPAAQRSPPAKQPILDGVGRNSADFCNLFDRIFQAMAENQHCALPFGHAVEVLARKQRVFSTRLRELPFFADRGRVGSAFVGRRAQRRPRRDPVAPAFQRAFPPITLGGLEDFEDAELRSVLRVLAIAKQHPANALDAVKQASDQDALSGSLSPRDLGHQCDVIRRRGHRDCTAGLRFRAADQCCGGEPQRASAFVEHEIRVERRGTRPEQQCFQVERATHFGRAKSCVH